ncbi:DsrE family protein [Sulfuricystis multivorans]|uniref:DsrE family protein n=1 Tax=Sulfuricystis multivorans TaxID=2211108 RepID=UPI000F832267|nr:DsrE family protein [Sulfuricystis multivorans]
MKKTLWTVWLLVCFVFTGAALADSGRLGVAIQVSDDNVATWNQALNVVKNIQASYGKDKVEVELVVFGNGAGLLKFDSQLSNRIDDTLASGAKVLMCQNTMKAQKLTPEDMHAGIGYVKAGVVELIEKQRQGWAVIRP